MNRLIWNAVTRLILAAILVIVTVVFVACAGTTTTAVGVTTVQDADAADKPR